MVNRIFFAKRIQSDKVFQDKAFKISGDIKYDGCQRRLASMVYKFFDKSFFLWIKETIIITIKNNNKKSSESGVDAEQNYQLANELHRQIIRKLKRRKV